MEHAAIGMLPLYALCDRNDIGGISTPLHPDTGRPQVFIHDGHPEGVGIAEHGYEVILELWKATLDVISAKARNSRTRSALSLSSWAVSVSPCDKTLRA